MLDDFVAASDTIFHLRYFSPASGSTLHDAIADQHLSTSCSLLSAVGQVRTRRPQCDLPDNIFRRLEEETFAQNPRKLLVWQRRPGSNFHESTFAMKPRKVHSISSACALQNQQKLSNKSGHIDLCTVPLEEIWEDSIARCLLCYHNHTHMIKHGGGCTVHSRLKSFCPDLKHQNRSGDTKSPACYVFQNGIAGLLPSFCMVPWTSGGRRPSQSSTQPQ